MKIDVSKLIKVDADGGSIVDLDDILDLVTDDEILSRVPDIPVPYDVFRALGDGDIEYAADLLTRQFPELGSFIDQKKMSLLLTSKQT